MSAAKDQEYFSDGLAEQLINDLAKVSGLKVVGRSSAFQFKGRNEDLREVGRKLGVANILEGSVRRDGNHVRITAELIKTNDGFQLWSQTYDREINDIFGVEDEIAQAATEALQLKLLGGNGQPVTVEFTQHESRGISGLPASEILQWAGTEQRRTRQGARLCRYRLSRLDEKYAPAWALRSSVQNEMAGYGLTDATEGYRKARADAERAIALDPALASAYLALANTQIDYDWDWDAANISLTKAACLRAGQRRGLPSSFTSIQRYWAISIRQSDSMNRWSRSTPFVPILILALEYLLYVAGRYDDAQAELQKALDLNPQATLCPSHHG